MFAHTANGSLLIIPAIAKTGNIAPAQVRFEESVSLMRCKTKKLATAGSGHQVSIGGFGWISAAGRSRRLCAFPGPAAHDR